MSEQRVLVTGSRGFVGGSVGRAVNRLGWPLMGISRSVRPEDDWQGLHRQADIAIKDISAILHEFAPSLIVHAAGPSSVPASFESPLDDFRASVSTWANIVNAARNSDALVVLVSSAAVYGEPDILPVPETAPRKPLSPYGYHKALCETLAEEYASFFDMRFLLCRFFSLVGPGQRRLLPWEIFTQLMDPTQDEVLLRGSGDTTRDYLHIDDASDAMLRLCTTSTVGDPGTATVVNVASGSETRIEDVAKLLSERLTKKPVRCLHEHRPGDPERWVADISLLRRLVPDWRPRELTRAIDECIASWTR